VPVTLTVIAIGGMVASAYKGYKEGQAAKKQGAAEQEAANSQADLSDYNAAVADLQATDATARGAEQESRFRAGIRGMVGAQRSGFAAGNIDVGYGSAVDVQADTAYTGELDAQTIKVNAQREAWGFKVQAVDLRKRADIARKTGVYAEQAGRERATGAYIGAAASIAQQGASLYTAKYGIR